MLDDPSPPQIFASERARRQFLIHLVLLAVVVGGILVLVRPYLSFLTDAPAVRAYVRGFGALAPIVLITLQALQVILAPVPGQVLAAVAGYLFGPWLGTLYNMIGITLGSLAAFWLARRFGRTYAERIVDPDTLATFDEYVAQHGLLTLFVLFLIPGLPDDVLCFAGGLTPIRLWKLVVIAVIGRTPAFFLVNVFGDAVATGDTSIAVFVLVFVLGLSVIGYFRREWILARLR